MHVASSIAEARLGIESDEVFGAIKKGEQPKLLGLPGTSSQEEFISSKSCLSRWPTVNRDIMGTPGTMIP